MHTQFLQIFAGILLDIVQGETIVDMMRYHELDGKSCTQHLFETVAKSNISCVTLCSMEPTCFSSFYAPESGLCIGCDDVYSDSDLSPLKNVHGSLYYRPYAKYNQSCSKKKPCGENNTVCFSGLDVCVCDPAFVYDPSSASCKTGCNTYGSTYQVYPNHYLRGHSHKETPDYGMRECLSKCSSGTFQCYSLDYEPRYNRCWYNVERAANVIAYWNYTELFDNYARNCASIS